ncbi:MAG: 16S rRNA (cytosine(1402)-N(4))-methyltransferase RsmH [Gemmatales bacterium]
MYRSTPHGEHVPVLLAEVLAALDPQPGDIVFDGTLGFAGHACELLESVGPTGLLLGTDFDPVNLEQARLRLTQVGFPFAVHHGNFAGVQQVMGEHGVEGLDGLLVDLGMSSMQVDDPERGFSYMRDGPLDMRMDMTRGKTAADLLNQLPGHELEEALRTIGDEENAELIVKAIVARRGEHPLTRTTELSQLIAEAVGVQLAHRKLRTGKNRWSTHPAARTFQTLRIMVNRELANLEHLLRVLPLVLKPGGRAAIISFHSGEDRLVKQAFKQGLAAGTYSDVSDGPIRAAFDEQQRNPRSRSAKLRWARRSVDS